MNWGALWIVVLEILLLPPVLMAKPRCVRVCRGAIHDCVEQGGRRHRCRRSFLRLCRQLGPEACLRTPPSTTTTRPPPEVLTTSTTLAVAPSTTTTTRPPDDFPRCGNGKQEPGEACDGTDLGEEFCGSLGPESGGGTLRCNPDCLSFDRTGCHRCGNGILDGAFEVCDGLDFGGKTCASFGGGDDEEHGLRCSTDCTSILTDDCFICGNGRLDPGEECDSGSSNGAPNGGCSATCRSRCGDGTVQKGEECDDGGRVSLDGCSESCLLESPVDGGTSGDTPAKPPIDACYAVWRVLRAAPGEDVACRDGADCDGDPTPGRCAFDYVACFNRPQGGPGACTPSAHGLTAVSADDPAFLAAAQGVLGGELDGLTLTLPDVTARNRCVTGRVDVPIGTPASLKVATTDGTLVDLDELRFTCTPAD